MQQGLIQPSILQFARIRRGSHLAIGAIRRCRCQRDKLERACHAWQHSDRARRGTALLVAGLRPVRAGLLASLGQLDSFERRHAPVRGLDLSAGLAHLGGISTDRARRDR
jgi:hypothetical protein